MIRIQCMAESVDEGRSFLAVGRLALERAQLMRKLLEPMTRLPGSTSNAFEVLPRESIRVVYEQIVIDLKQFHRLGESVTPRIPGVWSVQHRGPEPYRSSPRGGQGHKDHEPARHLSEELPYGSVEDRGYLWQHGRA